MAEGDETQDEKPPAPLGGRVKILGAKTAGEKVGLTAPKDVGQKETTLAAPLVTSPAAELPHWTEMPTGEVPAVLSRTQPRDTDEASDAWSQIQGPVWRQERADWIVHEETFDASVLADDEGRLGSLADTRVADRDPWSFEHPTSGELTESDETASDVVERVSGTEQNPSARDRQRTASMPETPSVPRHASREPSQGSSLKTDRATLGQSDTATQDLRAPATQSRALSSDALLQESQDLALSTAAGLSNLAAGLSQRSGRAKKSRRSKNRIDDARIDPVERLRSLRDARPEDTSTFRRSDLARELEEERVAEALERANAEQKEGTDSDTRESQTSRRPVVRVTRRERMGSNLPHRVGAHLSSLTQNRLPEPEGPSPSDRNMPVAIVSGLIFGIAALLCFHFGNLTSEIIVTIVVALATVEAYGAFRRAGHAPAAPLGIAMTIFLMVATYNRGIEALQPALAVLVVLTLLWHLARVQKGADPIASASSTVLVFCWIGVLGSYSALLLDPSEFPSRHGVAFLLGAVIAVAAYDVAALSIGRWLGKRPIAPLVSPNKTLEGLIGGTIFSILVSLAVVRGIHPWTVASAFYLGVIVSVLSPLGDLVESLLKRFLGRKDMGNIMPGHGGILDRVDGLLFVLPAVFVLAKLAHLG